MSAQALEARMARLEGSYEQIARRLGDLASHMDARFAQVDARLDTTRETLDAKIDGLQWRMTALIVGTWIATMSAVFLRH